MNKKQTPQRSLDAQWHAAIGQVTGGLSPAALATAYVDLWLHVIGSPEKRADNTFGSCVERRICCGCCLVLSRCLACYVLSSDV